MRFVQAIIACASHLHTSYRLGKCPLDASSGLIVLAKGWCVLFLSACLQGLMSSLRTHMQHSTSGCRLRAVAAYWTPSTRLFRKNDFYSFSSRTKALTGLALRAGGAFCLPVKVETPHVKAFACFGLPTVV